MGGKDNLREVRSCRRQDVSRRPRYCWGDRIPEEIIRQITRCKEFVVLLTPRSVDRPWVLLEVGMALRNGRRTRIVPILYHVGVDPIPEMIKDRKAIDLNEFENYAAEVSRKTRRH